MRHLFAQLALTLIAVVVALPAPAQRSEAAQRTLRCESGDGREHHCVADTVGGVRLLRQLSRSACAQGRTWGVDRSGIWVSQGCRAEFALGSGGNEYSDLRASRGRMVRCESDSGRSNLCVMDTRHGVELVSQLSRSSCVREQNWGWNDRGVWVSGGCRGDFRARGARRRDDSDRNSDRVPLPARQSVRCESIDGAQRRCPADAGGGVRLSRQLSRTTCVERSNWGYDRRGIWVDGGCRADFEVAAQPRLGER